jgi:NAD(P)-dependent dehydrogenase (short-subunit alcohol dehydrogenase family)
MDRTKKFIVLTGVTRGLGRALLEGFIAEGHTVAGCGRNAKGIDELRKTYSAPHRFDAVDVTSDTAVTSWAMAILKDHPAPDLLINNAAIINRAAPLWEISAEEFDQVIGVNIIGVANVIRHFVPAMIARGCGVIANFSSGWGQSTSPEVAPYCSTKFAIEGLTHALAQELPPGMAAVPVNPGIIDTEMLRTCFGDAAGSYPTPKLWARRAVPFFLALNPRHNGQSLAVDAGAK